LINSKELTMNNKINTEADLLHAWKEMSAKKFDNKKLKKQEIMNAIQSKSELSIFNLKTEMNKKIKWGIFAVAFFVLYAFASFNYKEEFLFLLLLALSSGVLYLIFHKKVKKMNDDLSANTSVLKSMKTCKNAMSNMLNIERIWGYSMSLLLFMFFVLRKVMEAVSPIELIFFIVTMTIIVIVAILFSERQNKKFRKEIKELEENIIRLETLK